MTSDSYLRTILAREAVDTGLTSPVRQVGNILMPIISNWAGRQLVDVKPSGSFAKSTANDSGTDIGLFISLHEGTTNTLKEIYTSLARTMEEAGYKARLQNVSINVKVGAYDVDLVPAKRQNSYTTDHSLYRWRADTWTKTNIDTHIAHVQRGGRIDETRILKLWRNQKGLDFPSFYLELATIEALRGHYFPSLDAAVWAALAWLRDRFASARFVDPANGSNVISDDLSQQERERISGAARRAREATNWNQIVT